MRMSINFETTNFYSCYIENEIKITEMHVPVDWTMATTKGIRLNIEKA